MVLRVVIPFVVMVSGCSHAELPWPKSAGTVPVTDWRQDGGQSLEPSSPAPADKATSSAAVVEEDDDDGDDSGNNEPEIKIPN